MPNTVVKWALVLIGVIALLVMAALAVPVQLWRTGEVAQPELHYATPARDTVKFARVWIDADAACGTGKRRDPDDCLALLSLASADHIEIAGISTVFGNAPVSEADQVMRAPVQELFWRSEVGLDGFYPFDLMAAAYLRDPANFGCARVTAWVGDDALLPWFGGGPSLLVSQQPGLPASVAATAQALYCDRVTARVDALFL